MLGTGKLVGDDLYVHLSAIGDLADVHSSSRIHAALDSLPEEFRARVNVAKINTRTDRVSLLEYAAFGEDPFPALCASWTSERSSAGAFHFRSYADSLNPPVLHRKELLLRLDDPARPRGAAVTRAAEAIGLFDEPGTIGFRLNWQRAIAGRGYTLVGDEFRPIGNDTGEVDASGVVTAGVARHLTALSRTAISAPVQILLRHGLLAPDRTFFDYGCGRGDDVAALSGGGFAASGWDPHYAPERERMPADVVNVGFVVNVIEDPAERVDALHKAFGLTRGVMAVAVMLYGADARGVKFGDGVLTSRGTFQKYFSQAEFKDFLEQVLHQEVFLVGPGIAFVFADKAWEQQFLAQRYRRQDIGSRLLQLRARTPAPTLRKQRTRTVRSDAQQTAPHPLLAELWRTSLELGRLPEPAEVPYLEDVNRELGGLTRALRKLDGLFDRGILDAARAVRVEDLRLYFAMLQFARRPRYKQLEPRLQRDVKAFFGDYKNAQEAGLGLLKEAADSDELLKASQLAAENGLGWLDGEHDLQLHLSLVERLPSVLRAYIACGLQLYGDLTSVDLVKIHISSGKLTFMQFENFEEDPLPPMKRRIKVNVRRATVEVFEYGTEFAMPLLYQKSRYVHEEMSGYAQQLAFDEALSATGLLGDSEFGPSAEELVAACTDCD